MSQTLSQTRREDLSSRERPTHAQAALYVALEGERPLSGGLRAPLQDVREVRIGRGATRAFHIDGHKATLEVPDPRMSSKHARLVREEAGSDDNAPSGWLLEDLGSTNGSFVEGKRTTQALLEEPTVITLGATCFLFDPEEPVPAGTKVEVVDSTSLKARPRGTATLVPALAHAMPRLVLVSASKLSVLLLGESGAGKEVLARTVHQISGRQGQFVAINCGALAPTLIESQLFGHVKGAFSGATRDEPGLVRSSSGGTLFLDEIGELPASAQATLLRVIQEKEVLPVGGTRPVTVDLRVVSATLKPIDETPTFRADLYARISAFIHRLTPLRERRGDLGILIADLLPRIALERAQSIRFAPDLATALASHSFPLNVRELEHLISVALVTSPEDLLRLESVGEALKPAPDRARPERPANEPRESRPQESSREPASSSTRSSQRQLSEEELKLKEELSEALTRTRGNVSEISRTMGKTRMQIHRWMKRFGLDPETFRD